MAILELDNHVLRDERFTRLGELCKKSKFDARGRVEALWYDCIEKTSDIRTAEEIDYLTGWFEDDLGSFADLMVRAKLAEPLLDGSKQLSGKYRIRGVKDKMKWLADLRQKRAEAGSIGGKRRAESAERDEHGHFIPSNRHANVSENPSDTQALAKQNIANPGGTVSGSGTVPVPGSSTGSEIVAIEKKNKKPTAEYADASQGKMASEVIARYCELWKEKYKTAIHISGKWTGNAKTLVKDHGKPRAINLVEAFMEMNDQYFLRNRHSFSLILTNLAQITHYAGTGVQITQTQLNQFDRTTANKNAGEEAAKHFLKGGT